MDRRHAIQSGILGVSVILFGNHALAQNRDFVVQLDALPHSSTISDLHFTDRHGPDVEQDLHVEHPTESYSAKQKQLYREYTESGETADRDRTAYILSELWRENRLRKKIKDRLVDAHYHFVLLQIYGESQSPNFVVRCSQMFPFPDVWTHFTPILYVNGEIIWEPTKPQKSHAMSLNNSTITSHIGGAIKSGDSVQYQIRMHQEVDNEVAWNRTLWTNRVVVQGLEQ